MKHPFPPFLLVLICLAVLGLSACGTLKSPEPPAPATFDMVQIAPRVHVDPKMTEKQRQALSEAIAIARQRIRLYFGNVVSDPEITACSTEQCFLQSGGETAQVKAYGESRLLLSPRQLTAPMIAHEWSHAEFYTRVGDNFVETDTPPWFDEGLAVLVSNEPAHSEEIWQVIKEAGIATPVLNELESPEKWLAAEKKYGNAATNKEQYKILFATAGHEVRRWYRRAGKAGLGQLIDAIRQGRPFARAYQEAQGRVLPDHSSAYRNFNPGSRARVQ